MSSSVIFSLGDEVYVEIKEHRTDDKITFRKAHGIVVEAFNAWSPAGDRWQYKIQTKQRTIVVFYEGYDEGTMTLTRKP